MITHETDAEQLLKTFDPLADQVKLACDEYARTGDGSRLDDLINRHPQMQPVLNMLMAPPRWTPEPWQICRARNPSYLNALWIGTVWNVIMLPSRFWPELLRPLLWGRLELVLTSLWSIPATFFGMIIYGLLGRLHSLPLSPMAVSRTLVMDDEDAEHVVQMGAGRLLSMIPGSFVSVLRKLPAET